MKNLGSPGGRVDFWYGTQTNAKKFHTWGASWQHAHKVGFTFDSGTLKATALSINSGTAQEEVDFSTGVKDMEGDSAAGTLSWSTYGGTTGNFNIAEQIYHKTKIQEAYKAGYSAGFAQCQADTQYTASSYTKESHSYTKASHYYKASSHSENADGTCSYTASSHSYTPASHSYTASSYTASTFSPAQESTPSSGWEAYY